MHRPQKSIKTEQHQSAFELSCIKYIPNSYWSLYLKLTRTTSLFSIKKITKSIVLKHVTIVLWFLKTKERCLVVYDE